MAYFRNPAWKNDEKLKDALNEHIRQGLQRSEINFLRQDFPEYSWSTRMLDRRLHHFNIYHTDPDFTVEEIADAVKEEVDSPGKDLGIRAMHNKLRQQHAMKVPRDFVHAGMTNLDPTGLANRGRNFNKQKRVKGNFTTRGTNWVHSYGCIDAASQKLLWIKVWTSNSDPELIGRWYLKHLFESRLIARRLRIDKGTETGDLASIHAFLRDKHGDMEPKDTVIYGPPTANQNERWWRMRDLSSISNMSSVGS
eukprot:gene21036-23091_t